MEYFSKYQYKLDAELHFLIPSETFAYQAKLHKKPD